MTPLKTYSSPLVTAKKSLFLFIVFILSGALFFSQNAVAQCTAPTNAQFVDGNPDCGDIGTCSVGFKYDNQPFGEVTLLLTSQYGLFTCFPIGTNPNDEGNSITINSDGKYFDWVSTLPIDKVIVKGGPNANVYCYDPESTGDMALHAPINPNTNMPYAISHIEFCYDYNVDVFKDAHTTFTRTYDWTIDKSVTPETWNLFSGDSGNSKYTVSVTKGEGTDNDWAVNGSITIANNTPFDATITSISDIISGGINATVDCGSMFPVTIPPGGTLGCTYFADMPDGANRINVASVTTTGFVEGGESMADVTFGAPTTEINASINVDDTNGASWLFSESDAVMYEKTFLCGEDEGVNENTATIRETGQSDGASVTINCYNLEVAKTANTSYNLYWDWTIDKLCGNSTMDDPLNVMPGQPYEVQYTIDVAAVAVADDHTVSGEIVINNPNPYREAELLDVIDLITPDDIAGLVACPSWTVPAGGSLTCTYTADLPDAISRVNTAIVTQQNYAFTFDLSPVPAGTTDFSGAAPVIFGNTPADEFDECIDIMDTNPEFVDAIACASISPSTFNYPIVFQFMAPDDCGPQLKTNTATFITNDNANTGSDDCVVYFYVECQDGCTLTHGYWKTHSEFGPAPYDDTWALLPDGASTSFFLSGQTYYEVLWTPPQGNVYYVLAKQYIAAQLNFLNDASSDDAQTAFDEATEFFMNTTPADAAALKGRNKRTINSLATTLDDYNNGLIGPGHCDDDDNSDRIFDFGQMGNDQAKTLRQSSLVLELNTPTHYQIRPNPVRDQMELVFNSADSGWRQINIYSITGELVQITEYEAVKGQNNFEVNMNNGGLSSGMYFIRVADESKVLWNGKFIKY
jgi:hypothetical protein